MARTIKAKVELKDIHFDEELYPRSHYDWRTAYDYSQSIKAGAKFPAIILALFKGKKYLVDGKHRIEAHKSLKLKSINAVVHTGWNKEKIYKEAIRYNIIHGRGLSPYEKRLIAVKLMEMRCKRNEISELIRVPLDKLESFVAQRLVNSITGEEITSSETEDTARQIGKMIIKSGIKQFAGEVMSDENFADVKEVQKSFNMISQLNLFKQVVHVLEHNLLDKSNKKVVELVQKTKKLLKSY